MNYQMFPKTNIGLEVVGGITDQSSSPLQYYQQARVRVNYVATGKLDLKFSGGVEVREFEGSNSIKTTPVFSLGFEYRPFDGTTLSVVGYRNVSAATSSRDRTLPPPASIFRRRSEFCRNLLPV